jgi:transcriptional regulator with GAF, ATPase, and Fis domain
MKNNPDNIGQNQAAIRDSGFKSENRLRSDASRQGIADLKAQLKSQKLISEISAKFVNLPAGTVDSEIENGLKSIVESMGIDRCGFGEFSEDQKTLSVTHSYQKPGIEPSPKVILKDVFPWYGGNLISGKVVVIEKPADWPENAVAEKSYCQRTGLKSILTIPVSVGGSLVCGISVETFRTFHSWQDQSIEQLRVLGEVFANALHRKRAEEEIQKHLENLQKQLEFEQLISGLSAEFVNLPAGQVNQQIEQSLKQLVDFLGVDRSTFFRLSQDKNELIPICAYSIKDVERVGGIPLTSWFPWASARILRGEAVVFSSADELPPEADRDRMNLDKIDLKSNIIVPLFMGGKVEYALSVSNVTHPREWKKGVAPRLRLVGEIFTNALIRSENIETMQKKDKELQTAYNRISKISKKLAQENRYFQDEIKASFHSSQIIGISGGLKYIFYRLKQVASTDTTVLIEGETGTGKELIARALHEFSQRKERPLIKIDCATLHDNMIESELFGHEKGSFTGAHERHIGRIELADDATIFLDEVGEIPLPLQAKLLRVIEYGEFERLGSSHTRKVNIRIIAATNRNLDDEVKNGKFRQDLFYRLNVFPLSLPPLRERKEDIPVLTEWFVKQFNNKMSKKISGIPGSVLKALQDYSWPGNVRELENVIERAMITSQGPVLQLMDNLTVETPLKAPPVPGETLQEMERNQILRVLKETHWRIEGNKGAALKLGLHPDTLRSRLKRLGIRRPAAN